VRRPPVVAVAGASGAVGRQLLELMVERRFAHSGLRLLASARSAGRSLNVDGLAYPVEVLSDRGLQGIDLAFFATDKDTARRFVPVAAAAGAVVIDNSSAFRQDADTAVCVPEVNASVLTADTRRIANPNCTTILVALALAPIHRAVGIRRVVVASYQAASGAGQAALEELREQSRSAGLGTPMPPPKAMTHQLHENVIPLLGTAGNDAYSDEEDKLAFELPRLLGAADLLVEATCARVPVERCHAAAVTVETAAPVDRKSACRLLAAAPGLELLDDAEAGLLPMPLVQAHRDAVGVGRIRASRVFESGLTLWVCGDQLRKGAALNALQIAEQLPW
jgi:aspartate-semialdehyde dehydrogenase